MSLISLQFKQRKIIKSYRSITGHIPSIKNNKSIAFESKLENTCFLTLEFDNDILSYQEQPQFEIIFNNRKSTYSADCYIQRPKGSKKRDAIIEVKYTTEIEKDKEYFERRFKAIEEATEKLDLDFIVFTEETHPQQYIDNIHFLYRYRTQDRESKYDEQILNKLQNTTMKAKDLAQSISKSPIEYNVIANAIWGLVASDILSTDLYVKELNMSSEVKVNDE
ncbi:MAG: hypothetical protein DRG78_05950 [Epsilonproteobacteria bacterium]|nr:MAG: hypothetical protein DRG78_05950 [Campylobacterota bacterium]